MMSGVYFPAINLVNLLPAQFNANGPLHWAIYPFYLLKKTEKRFIYLFLSFWAFTFFSRFEIVIPHFLFFYRKAHI